MNFSFLINVSFENCRCIGRSVDTKDAIKLTAFTNEIIPSEQWPDTLSPFLFNSNFEEEIA